MDIKKRIREIDPKNYFKKANLHAHSNCSDGKLSFEDLVAQAKTLGLEHFAITDHNCVKGYLGGIDESFLIPAVEFDCFLFPSLLHIIGYGVDVFNPELRALCSDSQEDLKRVVESRNPEKVIDTIHKAGGMAVFAHPCCCWVFSLDRYVKKLKSFGLDGIEAYYPYDRFRGVLKFHKRETVLKLARKYDLIPTGGSDAHGAL